MSVGVAPKAGQAGWLPLRVDASFSRVSAAVPYVAFERLLKVGKTDLSRYKLALTNGGISYGTCGLRVFDYSGAA